MERYPVSRGGKREVRSVNTGAVPFLSGMRRPTCGPRAVAVGGALRDPAGLGLRAAGGSGKAAVKGDRQMFTSSSFKDPAHRWSPGAAASAASAVALDLGRSASASSLSGASSLASAASSQTAAAASAGSVGLRPEAPLARLGRAGSATVFCPASTCHGTNFSDSTLTALGAQTLQRTLGRPTGAMDEALRVGRDRNELYAGNVYKGSRDILLGM